MTSAPSDQFASLKISPAQIANLQSLGYDTMTPIQAQSLPLILNGQDVIARAKTGSGKTCAFGIGLLDKIEPSKLEVQALILCPTRELAEQVTQEVRRLAKALPNVKLLTLCGGKPFGLQKNSLSYGAHVVVGTPGRILDHLGKGTLRLKALHTLVLDEADRMLDMGFTDAMSEIIGYAPTRRQTLLFSATYPAEIKKISAAFQTKPQTVTVDADHQPGVIDQLFYEVEKHQRNNTLLALFEHYNLQSALVFCHTKVQCNEVSAFLNNHDIQALAIHGDFEQRDRDQVLIRFANRSCSVLVATDVAARGLDIKSLEAVINYELPRDPEVYVHRVGRTGRAGAKGYGFSLFTAAEQIRVRTIEDYQQQPCLCDVYASLDRRKNFTLAAPMTTMEINVGRKHKMRPGDILGALTGDAGLPGTAIGKIDILDVNTYVAIERVAVNKALEYLEHGRIKTKKVRARIIGGAS